MPTFLAWFVASGIITIRDIKTEGRAPYPSEFVAAGAVFAGLSLLSAAQPELAGVLAWGLLIAIALQLGPEGLTGGKVGKGAVSGATGAAGGAVSKPLGGPSKKKKGKVKR